MELHPLIIDINVTKEQQKHPWIIEKSGTLSIRHKEPESRDANEFIIKILAEALHLSHSQIIIVHGTEERKKRVKINKSITKDELIKIIQAVPGI